jgi:hypothetical protein
MQCPCHWGLGTDGTAERRWTARGRGPNLEPALGTLIGVRVPKVVDYGQSNANQAACRLKTLVKGGLELGMGDGWRIEPRFEY